MELLIIGAVMGAAATVLVLIFMFSRTMARYKKENPTRHVAFKAELNRLMYWLENL